MRRNRFVRWSVFVAASIFVTASATAAPTRTPHAMKYSASSVVVLAVDDAITVTPSGTVIARDPRVASVVASSGLDRGRRLGRGAFALTSRRPDFDPVATAAALRATGAVKAATPDYRFTLFNTTPDDLYLIYQYYIDDNGFADVRLPAAWDITHGDPSVVIAIIDTGVDTGHPDLASKIWTNPGEIASNGIDDDGNGFIDDVHGWDFGVGDNDPNPEYTPDASGIDVGFHGTFCAGIAAATTNNGEGIAGAGWECRIMPLKVANPDSGITSSALAGAIAYAVDNGASIINMSLGGPGDPGVPEFFQVLVDQATFAGVLCVAAAGNDGDSIPSYPAACDRVLAVAATDESNARASFSNFGSWVDIAAPGAGMWSSIARNYTLSDLDQLIYIFFFGWDGANPYMFGDGTSFACPLTAGTCALVRSRYPTLPPQAVMRQVIATGDAVAFDQPIGPKLNAFRAVSLAPTGVESSPNAPSVARVTAAPNPVAAMTSLRFQTALEGRATLSIYDASGRLVRRLVHATMSAGPHTIPWDGENDRGSRLPAGVYFARLESGGTSSDSKVVLLGR